MSGATYREILARNIRGTRSRKGLNQRSIAVRMQALGYDAWLHQTVGNVENGRRRVTAEEIVGLALALETSIGALMDPSRDDREVTLPSGLPVPVGSIQRSIRHFNDGFVGWIDDNPDSTGSTWPWPSSEAGPELVSDELLDPFLDRFSPSIRAELVEVLRKAPVIGPTGQAVAKQPVVAAIVTSKRRVLVGKRNDRQPPWTFIAGEVEPGEQPEDAAEREVKEETGLEVRISQVIGERDHPATGRHMIYLAAKPAGRSTRIAVGDEAELAEVRWVSLAEAGTLMPDMFPAVRDYLGRVLAAKSGRP